MPEFIFEVLRLNNVFIQAILNFNSDYPLCVSLYLLPSAIAFFSKKHNRRTIFVCNLLLGFTGITWFVILIWAAVEQENKPGKPQIAKECDHCKELIRLSATVCHHCHQELEKT
jgi:hypothetical protein